MIVFTVILHAYSLSLLNTKVTAFLNKGAQRGRPLSVPSFLIGATALALTLLHGAECAFWAAAYRLLGASTDNKSAMLYSVNVPDELRSRGTLSGATLEIDGRP
jgi:hypothetical protein